MLQKRLLVFSIILFFAATCFAQKLISDQPRGGGCDLKDFIIYVDDNEPALVKKAAVLLQEDIARVISKKLPITNQINPSDKNIIAIGTIVNAAFIKNIGRQTKFNKESISGKWEAYQLQTINKSAGQTILVIAGSDRRGAAYGVFELSRQMGISPWYWWADVPVKKAATLYIDPAIKITDAPKVKYRGIFINDEAPAFSGWAKGKFGGINHKVYEKVFELILRLKGNYLWPAMWGNAFNDDDKLSPLKADEWGIVMGTSHHEPMLRSQQEWKRYGTGKWDYDSNATALRSFWKKGIENMGKHESILTIGMRGDGDEPMTEQTATALLERIVKDQRAIIADVTKKPAAETPQLWALYKEVQDYYEKGMRVPDDVTLLLCDDNWGNIRKLPKLDEKPRKGGYGIYYHFDYVGGPRNYKWVNTNQISKIWEQMHLAWEYKARQIWVVNVGDIKPMEVPLSFFLDYAWNPEKIQPKDLQAYNEQWCAAQFGAAHAKQIASIIASYTKFNARKKPELLDATTYSLENNEWSSVVDEYNSVLKQAREINDSLPAEYKSAYFQLVLHPVMACANLNELYYNVALNTRAYKHKWASANSYADNVKRLYENDSLITRQYHQLNGGKWNHMMDQTHIGYTYWQQPLVQKMPAVHYVPADSVLAQVTAPETNNKALVPANAQRPAFYEDGKKGISIEAAHVTRTFNNNGVTWTEIPGLGRTVSGMTPFPVTAARQQPAKNSPRLEYDFYTFSSGDFSLKAYFSPTLNFHQTKTGLQYAVSIDDEAPQIISINSDDAINYTGPWNKWVADNIIIKSSRHTIARVGKHTVKYWMVDPAVVLEKLVIDFAIKQPEYLGPEETLAR